MGGTQPPSPCPPAAQRVSCAVGRRHVGGELIYRRPERDGRRRSKFQRVADLGNTVPAGGAAAQVLSFGAAPGLSFGAPAPNRSRRSGRGVGGSGRPRFVVWGPGPLQDRKKLAKTEASRFQSGRG